MEWYDFAICGYMVPILSVLFFPSDDRLTSIIATFSAFAAGYFARPLGGLFCLVKSGAAMLVSKH